MARAVKPPHGSPVVRSPAVVFTGPRQVVFEPVDIPAMRPDEVLVRSWVSWISNGTEGSFLRGERADGETPASADRPAPYPIVPGYQRVGEVVDAGAETDYRPGEVVFVTVSRVDGLATGAGGHVLCAPAHHAQLRRLPASPAPEAFAGLVLTQVGYNCGARPAVAPGDAAVVIGDGLVGHWSAQTLRHRGARVLMLGRHAARLARWRGADAATANERDQDPVEAVSAWAPERVQAIVDTVGTVPLLERLLPLLRHDGHLVSAGFCGPHGRIDIQRLRFREATLHTPSGWSAARLDATLAGVTEGWLETLPLITHRFDAEQAAEAWRCILDDRDATLGVLLEWRRIPA